MPELAEVDYFRRQWDPALRRKIMEVEMHPRTRVFRGEDAEAIRRAVEGQRLTASYSHGKRMLFAVTGGAWLGIHLGMTGRLMMEKESFKPTAWDHFVLRLQGGSVAVFRDPRQFGRVHLVAENSRGMPEAWSSLPPAVTSNAFTAKLVADFLQRRARAPIKGVILMQEAFPGIGNWMADEILWRAGLHPAIPAGRLTPAQARSVWKETRFVATGAMRSVACDFSDPPRGWLFHERWSKRGHCPKSSEPLRFATIGGRTTAWCPERQPWPEELGNEPHLPAAKPEGEEEKESAAAPKPKSHRPARKRKSPLARATSKDKHSGWR